MRIDPASVAAPGLKSWLLYAISRFLCYAWQELNSLHLFSACALAQTLCLSASSDWRDFDVTLTARCCPLGRSR